LGKGRERVAADKTTTRQDRGRSDRRGNEGVKGPKER